MELKYESVERGGLVQSILLTIKNSPGGADIDQLKEESGADILSLQRILKQLEREGKVKQVRRRVYALEPGRIMPPLLLLP